MAREERATGDGGRELTETETLLEELIEIGEETDHQMENEEAKKKQNSEKEKAQALEMRERAMETFGETRKRATVSKGNEEQVKKRRSSGDMFDWLREKIELDKEEKQQERKEKKEEREAEKTQHT